MDYKFILLEKKDHIATVTVNKPKILNAIDLPTILELQAAFNDVKNDPNIRVLVITGAGEKAFIAGGDIADLNSRDAVRHRNEFASLIHQTFNILAEMEKPVIAAINGYALGGGTELLLACDIRIASDNAKFGVPEINLGIFPGAGGTQRLSRQIPLCKAKELLFTGDMISAEEAERLGLINKVVPQNKLKEAVNEMAQKLASKAPISLGLLKTVVNKGVNTDLTAGLELEKNMVSLTLDTKDAHEGMRAFLEKRKAEFKGE